MDGAGLANSRHYQCRRNQDRRDCQEGFEHVASPLCSRRGAAGERKGMPRVAPSKWSVIRR